MVGMLSIKYMYLNKRSLLLLTMLLTMSLTFCAKAEPEITQTEADRPSITSATPEKNEPEQSSASAASD